MMTTDIKSPMLSLYKGVRDISGTEISFQDFLDGIATGKWQKECESVRLLSHDEVKQKALKVQQLNVTIGGTFSTNNNANLREASGYMAVDIDQLDDAVETVRLQLNNDPYTYASFASIRGKGLCIIIKIHPERWEESWEGIKAYYLQKYCRVVDIATGNVARRRFVSYDRNTYVNEKANVFKLYLKKERKLPKPQGAIIHTKNDIEFVIQQFEHRAIELHDSTGDWVRVGLAFASEFGTAGVNYFQRVSQFRHDYDPSETEKQYYYLCRNKQDKVRIATFYYIAKENGCELMTPKTKEIARTATMQKRQKIKADDVINSLVKVGGVDREEATEIVSQVYANKDEIQTDDTLFDQIELFLNSNYNLRCNEITHYIENDGELMLDKNLNSIYIAAAKVFEMKVTKDNVFSLLFSEFVPSYNPLKAFFKHYSHRKPVGVIDALANTINHDMAGNYVNFFLRKFMIGMVSSVYGEQCPLVPVLTGGINKGKTQFWRRLLPEELKGYYGESNFNTKESDDDMLMCKKILLMNDEFTGDLLVKHGKFKSLTDKHTFSIRKPYGKAHEDIPRLAMIAGTSNEDKILSDPTGNRRIIPINVISIDHAAYNSIDKIDLLMEAYHAYMDGERGDLNNEQIEFLEKHTGKFIDASTERDMIEKYFDIPLNKAEALLYSQGEILEYLNQVSGLKNLKKKLLSQEMKALGFPYSDGEYYKSEGKTKRGFWLYKRAIANTGL